jgi:hypothetical protein
MKQSPAKSCLDILNSGVPEGTGEYWIDPANTGTPIQAFCDMSTDGGKLPCQFSMDKERQKKSTRPISPYPDPATSSINKMFIMMAEKDFLT